MHPSYVIAQPYIYTLDLNPSTVSAETASVHSKQYVPLSSENIQKKEGGPDRSVSDNQSSSVTLYELAMKVKVILKEVGSRTPGSSTGLAHIPILFTYC